MKKRNLILQAAVASLFCAATVTAFAGSTSSAIGNSAQIASQAVSATSAIGSGSLQYTVAGAIPAGSYYVYVQLSGGATFLTPATPEAVGNLVIGSVTGTATVSAGTVLTGNTSIVAFPINVTTTLPANSTFTFKPLANTAGNGGITGAVAAAGTGTLNATMSLGASAIFNAGLTSIVADEAAAASGPIATFVSAINAVALSSGSFGATTAPSAAFTSGVAETAKINVLGGTTGVTLTGNANGPATPASLSLLDLGGFYFVDVSTNASATSNPLNGAVTGTYNLASDYPVASSLIGATLTGPAGFFTPDAVAASTGVTAGSVYLATAHDCSGAIATGTGTVNATGTTVTFASVVPPAIGPSTAADVTAGITSVTTSSIIGPVFVCMTAATPNALPLVAGQPSITATLTDTTTLAGAVNIASTPLYALTQNGGSAYVREYIPAAVSGYTSYIRVINTGGVASNVSVAVVSDTTGKTGIVGSLGSVPANGAITVPSSTIENAIVAAGGVAPTGVVGAASGWRPRLVITANTTIAVQSFIADVNGNFSEVSGGNSGNIAPAAGNINPFNQ